MQSSILNRSEFYDQLAKLPRQDLIDIIEEQNPRLLKHVERIEFVFKHKLSHLTWSDGTPIEGREVSNYELALLIDPPFQIDPELSEMGMTAEQQRSVHIASDPVMWATHYLNARPRAYQIWMLRHPKKRKILRAGRRLGKSWTMAVVMLWWAFTRNDAKILVMAPMKPHVELLYKAVMKMAEDKETAPGVREAITRAVTAPQFKIEFSNGSQISFFTTGMKSGGKCLTPDHDILTRDGWKPVADVEENETILAWDGDKYLWSDVSESHEYDFDGELVAHSGKQVSFRVTPNHKFATKTRAPGSEWRDTYAEDLKDYYIPTGANPVMRPNWTYSNAELELWGWWLAEGSGFIGKMARISQVKEHGRRRIVELAETLGLHYTTPQKEIRVQWTPPIFSGTNAYNKFIPRDLFDECNIGALLDGLLGGDGWMREKGWEYSSSSRQLAEDVQELGVRIGLRANLREKNISYRPVGGGLPNRHWIVSGYDYKQSVLDKDNLHREPYSGKVHCVTVPDVGYFVTRHNGLVHVTGNSDVARGQEAHLIILDEMDYMGPDDLDAIYVMLQDTDLEIGETKNEADQKQLIGASTPTGLRGKFWEWCGNPAFQEFWFPSMVNPGWNKAMEDEFHEEYDEMAYRHEVEADWGENAEGVYPRRYVDNAFLSGKVIAEQGDDIFRMQELSDWSYDHVNWLSFKSKFVMGVDWDKFGAGPNIVVLEIPGDDAEDPRFKRSDGSPIARVIYRQEIKRSEFVLMEAVDRIIELNKIFKPEWIYVDRGFGEMQIELLHDYGKKNPSTRLAQKVKGISFSQMIETRDPATKQLENKHAKPFMVENLRWLLERGMLAIPSSDEMLYQQLTNYLVVAISIHGLPRFEMAQATPKIPDHAHDALMLACLAYKQNYDELMVTKASRLAIAVPNTSFMPLKTREEDDPTPEREHRPDRKVRSMSAKIGGRNRMIKRKMF